MTAALRLLVVTLLPLGLLADDEPGDTGRSLFDQLTLGEDGSSRVLPYPFPRLLRQIEASAGFDAADDPIAKILIPRGRSLQREAASPDYYAFPRVVIALDRDSGSGKPVKNRLFLGYQERAHSIEVISYNETAGRFEFQVVDDYRSRRFSPRIGRQPRAVHQLPPERRNHIFETAVARDQLQPRRRRPDRRTSPQLPRHRYLGRACRRRPHRFRHRSGRPAAGLPARVATGLSR